MFRTVSLSIIRSLFTEHSAMVYVIQACRQLSSRTSVYKPVWHIPVLSVQWINSWWWTETLSETCRVSCQNKFGKLVHLVGFYYKEICYDARSHERKKNDVINQYINGCTNVHLYIHGCRHSEQHRATAQLVTSLGLNSRDNNPCRSRGLSRLLKSPPSYSMENFQRGRDAGSYTSTSLYVFMPCSRTVRLL